MVRDCLLGHFKLLSFNYNLTVTLSESFSNQPKSIENYFELIISRKMMNLLLC